MVIGYKCTYPAIWFYIFRMSRTGSQVRKRSASFRKVTRVKKKEETKGPEVSLLTAEG